MGSNLEQLFYDMKPYFCIIAGCLTVVVLSPTVATASGLVLLNVGAYILSMRKK